jgi:hypothetical protein
MNNLGKDYLQPYITRHNYENSLTTEYRNESNKNRSVSEDSIYHRVMNGIMAELH